MGICVFQDHNEHHSYFTVYNLFTMYLLHNHSISTLCNILVLPSTAVAHHVVTRLTFVHSFPILVCGVHPQQTGVSNIGGVSTGADLLTNRSGTVGVPPLEPGSSAGDIG